MKHQGGKNLRGNLVLVSHCSLEESEAQKGVHSLSELRRYRAGMRYPGILTFPCSLCLLGLSALASGPRKFSLKVV